MGREISARSVAAVYLAKITRIRCAIGRQVVSGKKALLLSLGVTRRYVWSSVRLAISTAVSGLDVVFIV